MTRRTALSLSLPAAALAQPAPPSAKAQEFMRAMNHGPGKLQAGDPAPDFDLKLIKSDERVRLSSFRFKAPVALVFGSYT